MSIHSKTFISSFSSDNDFYLNMVWHNFPTNNFHVIKLCNFNIFYRAILNWSWLTKVLFSQFNMFDRLPWTVRWMFYCMWKWCCLSPSMHKIRFPTHWTSQNLILVPLEEFNNNIRILIREHLNCENNCPCYDNCFDGCPCSYETEYCEIPDECKIDEQNTSEFGKCDQFNRSQFLFCTDNCDIYDTDCFHDCSVQFEQGNWA